MRVYDDTDVVIHRRPAGRYRVRAVLVVGVAGSLVAAVLVWRPFRVERIALPVPPGAFAAPMQAVPPADPPSLPVASSGSPVVPTLPTRTPQPVTVALTPMLAPPAPAPTVASRTSRASRSQPRPSPSSLSPSPSASPTGGTPSPTPAGSPSVSPSPTPSGMP